MALIDGIIYREINPKQSMEIVLFGYFEYVWVSVVTVKLRSVESKWISHLRNYKLYEITARDQMIPCQQIAWIYRAGGGGGGGGGQHSDLCTICSLDLFSLANVSLFAAESPSLSSPSHTSLSL